MGGCCGKQHKPLSDKTKEVLSEFFAKIDQDADKVISKDEAIKFWSEKFAKVNAEKFFDEVDDDRDDRITFDEFVQFWQQVRDEGYQESEIVEEITGMENGEAWKKWCTKDSKRKNSISSTRSSRSNKDSRAPSKEDQSTTIPEGVRISRRDSKS
mmetsp:Transcript_149090/g.415530  ORF Transcript_149090/g.415530 Transcript_149090/m.415530 type:complete len:155 (+) Transcript_149090:54-518(+)